MTDTTTGIILILIGLLAIVGAVLNWKLVTHSRKLVNMVFGDTVARTIYVVVGVLLVIFGIGRLIGINFLG